MRAALLLAVALVGAATASFTGSYTALPADRWCTGTTMGAQLWEIGTGDGRAWLTFWENQVNNPVNASYHLETYLSPVPLWTQTGGNNATSVVVGNMAAFANASVNASSSPFATHNGFSILKGAKGATLDAGVLAVAMEGGFNMQFHAKYCPPRLGCGPGNNVCAQWENCCAPAVYGTTQGTCLPLDSGLTCCASTSGVAVCTQDEVCCGHKCCPAGKTCDRFSQCV